MKSEQKSRSRYKVHHHTCEPWCRGDVELPVKLLYNYLQPPCVYTHQACFFFFFFKLTSEARFLGFFSPHKKPLPWLHSDIWSWVQPVWSGNLALFICTTVCHVFPWIRPNERHFWLWSTSHFSGFSLMYVKTIRTMRHHFFLQLKQKRGLWEIS